MLTFASFAFASNCNIMSMVMLTLMQRNGLEPSLCVHNLLPLQRQLPKWVCEPIFLAENCMKMKEFWPPGGSWELAPPPGENSGSATALLLLFLKTQT